MLKKSQRKRLQRLLADEDVARIPNEIGAYFQAMRDAGFTRREAFELTRDLHGELICAVFDVPGWTE